ncbi:MAG: VWD domain-containing protein, partial [Myxococcota bacterium]
MSLRKSKTGLGGCSGIWWYVAALVLASATLVFVVPGCTIQSSEDGEESAPAQELPEYACGDTLEGTVPSSPQVEAATGVAQYDYALDSIDRSIELVLWDAAGGSLGRITMRFDYELAERVAFFTNVVYEHSGEEVARQRTRMQVVDDRLASFTRHEAAGREAVLWATLAREADNQSANAFGLESLTLGVPAEADGSGPSIRLGEDLYRVATVLTGAGPLDEAAAATFIEATQAADISESADFQRMVRASEDPAWADHATLALRRCAASAIGGDEASLLEAQGLMVMSLEQIQQAQGCADQDNPFADVLKVEGILGAIGTGTTLTGLLIAAGVVSGGWTILGALVLTSVGSYVVLGKLDSFTQEQAKKAPGIRDLVNLGNDSSGSGGGNGGSSRGAGSRGDPHLLTFDGLDYDFQGAGEFVLFEPVAGDASTVQVRQEPASGICSNVALNTAAATEIGGVQVHLDTVAERALLLDGQPTVIEGTTLLLPGGHSIRQEGSTAKLGWATGEELTVRGIGNGRSLDIDVTLPDSRRSQVRGLLGNFDGDRQSDLLSRDGSLLPAQVTWEAVLEFGESYRIEDSESLFTYGPGQNTDTFTIEGFPSGPVSLDDLPPDVRDAAEQTCRDTGVEDETALSNCILDVGCTSDPAFADSHVGVYADHSLEVAVPIDFSGWIVEGDGNWEVAEDGRSVFQTINGPPTFFLSPESYLGIRITGRFEVQGGDDDYIGFVFGYQSPLTSAGDEPNDLVTQLLSWKGLEQNYYGGTAFEGF